jgi:energy-coupling factor transport system substrate-specific component
MYGFGLWWIMYLYAWPILALVTWKLRKMESALSFSILSGIFGLLFGLLCSIPYIFIGSAGADLSAGIATAFAWWIAGIPWDIVHGVFNFVMIMVLYKPMLNIMKKIKGNDF